jgi:prevent-host-death family protein
MIHTGAEEARNELPHLLDEAEKGRSTVITKHGRPVAALAPVEAYDAAVRQAFAPGPRLSGALRSA